MARDVIDVAALEALEPGRGIVLQGVPPSEYHAPPGISRSAIVRVDETTPHHQHALEEHPEEAGAFDSIPMQNGRAMHCVALEPDEFLLRFAVGPNDDRRTKAWKDFEIMVGEARERITPAQEKLARAMAENVRAVEQVAELLTYPHMIEASAYWRDADTGLLLKARPDLAVNIGHPQASQWILVDLKSTSTGAGLEAYSKTIVNQRLYLQAAHYSTGWQIATAQPVVSFVFAAVESFFPYAASAIDCDPGLMALGRVRIRQVVRRFAECERARVWPSYPGVVQPMIVPAWRWLREEIDEAERIERAEIERGAVVAV